MTDLSGQYLGRYYLSERLGEGGMAVVYKAFDIRLERDVAIKIIRSGAFPTDALKEVLKRFEREAKSLAKLSHPNIVKVYDYGEHEGEPYLVMEYLPGGTLKKMLGKPVPWQEAVRLILPVARGVAYAHQRGVLHRDIKPANVLITDGGEPMLSDFGIAKLFEGEQTTALTGSGMAIGTPEYMAPEQWTGITSPHSDLYSLGIVLYEMLTGRKPYVADTPAAILIKQATEPLPSPRKFASELPEAIELVLIKALAREPEDRYKDLNTFITALENLHVSAPVVVPPPDPKRVEETYRIPSPKPAVPAPTEIVTKVGSEPMHAVDVVDLQKMEEPLPTKVTVAKTRPPIRFSRRGVGILIGGVVVILAVLLGSPLIGKLFAPALVATKMVTTAETSALPYSTVSVKETLPVPTSTSLPPSATPSPSATASPTTIPTFYPMACRQEPVRWSDNGHYYLGVCEPRGIDWTTAKNQAIARGGYLATIASSAENKFVFKLIDDDIYWWVDDLGSNEGPWLGGIQSSCKPEPLCGWHWVTGETWVYASWNEGEPNNMGSNENVTVYFSNISKIRADKWNDVGSSQTMKGYVIEWDNDPSTPTPIPEAGALPSQITDDKGVEMVLVPAREFTMGSNSGNADAKPAHQVYLDQYYIDKYEVTNKLYKVCVIEGICAPPTSVRSYSRLDYYENPEYDNYPVIYVSWNMAKTYCEWRDAGLSTEAQWEKAARGTDGRTYPWGESINCGKGNFYDHIASKICVGDTQPVGDYEDGISPYGIYDMAGNVSEWVADWYSETYYQISPLLNPLGPDLEQKKVIRGSHWNFSDMGSFMRNKNKPSYQDHYVGFRCAKDATP